MDLEIHKLTIQDQNFPYKLHSIKPKIDQIFYLGEISLLSKKILGIVGPRKQTEYGIQVLHKLFEEIPYYDIVTISGMAEGTDQLCHHLSIQHKIPTIAILGAGIQRYLKQATRHMMYQIIENGGLILSEYPHDMEPQKYTFPARNRIIAGLSEVLFVPEASKKSGSLITINNALDMGKPVYATANSIFSPSSEGIHALLEEKKISFVYDFKKFLKKFFTKTNPSIQHTSGHLINSTLSEQELKIITILTQKSQCGLQDLMLSLGMEMTELMSLLTILEMNNHIYQSMPGIYSVR